MISLSKNKLKVCFVSHFAYPLFNKEKKIPFGGKEVQLYLLSKELARNNNLGVKVITGDNKLKSRRIEAYNNLNLYISLPTKKTFINKIKSVINFFLTLFQMNPDVLIQRGGSVLTGLCALYSKIFKKIFIFSIAHRNDVIKNGKQGLIRLSHWYGINNADYIIAQNHEQIQEYEDWKKRKIPNITVIKSGYEIKSYEIKKKKYVLWVSRADRWKRPELFLKLTKLLPKEKFIMICSKGGDILYWESIKKASSISNLKFLNFIPFHKIDRYFKEAKIFINTSINEGFPNTFIQAFKNKTPVISLNVNPDEILTKNKIGIFCHDDLKKMEFSINQLLENQELYDSYSKNAFTYVKNNHDIKIISKKWFVLIEKINDNHLSGKYDRYFLK